MSFSKLLDLSAKLDGIVSDIIKGNDRMEELNVVLEEMKGLTKSSKLLMPQATVALLVHSKAIISKLLRGANAGGITELVDEAAAEKEQD
jgi:uncharacterized protein YaaN involved in tellurite resistance